LSTGCPGPLQAQPRPAGQPADLPVRPARPVL